MVGKLSLSSIANPKMVRRTSRTSITKLPRRLLVYGLISLTLSLAFAVTVAVAQHPNKLHKIGRLSQGSLADPISKATLEAFQDGLRELGWRDGQNISVDNRWAGATAEDARRLAAELVRLNADVIVAVGSPMVEAAKQTTNSIPIVMSGSGADPEAAGFVASLRRPGGNITGLSMLSTELSGKRLELLKEITAKLERVAVLRNPKFPAVAIQSKETDLAAKSLGLQLRAWDVVQPQDIYSAFSSMTKAKMGGLVVFSDPAILERNRKAILDLARESRLPTLYPWRNYVEEGGLSSYSASLLDMHRRAATYVDKILKGAKPAELPVEQPVKFEFIVNLKAAKQIGLAIPPNVLARADRVIK